MTRPNISLQKKEFNFLSMEALCGNNLGFW